MPEYTSPESACLSLLERYGLTGLIESAPPGGWRRVGDRLEEVLKNHSFKDNIEKNVFVDLFFGQCLPRLSPRKNSGDFWPLLEKWFHHRNPPNSADNLSVDEHAAAILVTIRLRDSLRDWLVEADYESLQLLGEQYQNLMLSLWRQVFLNMAAPHNMSWEGVRAQPDPTLKAHLSTRGFTGLLAASMYFPLDADEFTVDCDALFEAPLPLHCRNILICWLINIPYFNGDMKHRDRLVRCVPELCSALLKRPELLSATYFVSLVQEIMTSFWRASYIGGNNVAALSAFGDLIHTTINRLCPGLAEPVRRNRKPGDKIRLGYISRNVHRQAVPYYMINRVIHHDRSKFEVFVFSLSERKDDFTEIFINNSDHFQHFTDLKNFGAIINSVLGSELDILIYTDIGMDVVTYVLGGLRLAPVQCVMVGHGTTTGLPTMDYYLSGDFEAPEADKQYREILVRLPNLGAAQFLPDAPLRMMTREGLGVPEDAVLFISCANGIKHRAEREHLYIEILKQAPNAWILIKPYTTPGNIDTRLAKRFRTAAIEAGVNDRLLILPSIDHYRSVLGLLEIADVQLDTFPYGGWTTNMEALYCGLPIITQEGELSRSRWGAGMLRALGISEGIASNETEFVAWAVKLAQDHALRRQLADKIKAQACDVLFNGKKVQAAFEQALFDIVPPERDEPEADALQQAEKSAAKVSKQLGCVNIIIPERIYIATSIAPRNYPGQQAALATWQQAGFDILAVNPVDEIEGLRPHFPGIRFVAAKHDARHEYQKPYIYFDDLLDCLAQTGAKATGIINADIHLVDDRLHGYLASLAEDSVIFGSRFDASSPASGDGKVYSLGFDYFFFHHTSLAAYPKESFCLGLPWWDFWAALIPLERKHPLKRLVTPAVVHVSHQAAWDKEVWLRLGRTLAKYFPASSPLADDTMLIYLNQCAQRINRESVDVRL